MSARIIELAVRLSNDCDVMSVIAELQRAVEAGPGGIGGVPGDGRPGAGGAEARPSPGG